jgi:Protein of unknown function (DUF3823) N-terminal domain/Domain of unknown function (DUF3823_C)
MKYPSLTLAVVLFAGVWISSCSKDPYYTPPQSSFTGTLVYQGNPIGVANNGQGGNVKGPAANSVYFELFQPGYPLNAPISIVVGQNGSFSDLLYDGTYKLLFPAGIFPFLPADADSMTIVIKGKTNMSINVIPYYTINNDLFALSSSDSTVTATFDLTRVIGGTNAEPINSVLLYIGRTSFIDDGSNAAFVSLPGSSITGMTNLQLSLKVPSSLNTNGAIGAGDQNDVYVRLGVKVGGIPQLWYSGIQKLSFQ